VNHTILVMAISCKGQAGASNTEGEGDEGEGDEGGRG